MFAIALVAAAGLVFVAYRYSTRTAGHIAVATACFWLISMALFWLNESTFPNDETRREMGEWIAVRPLLVAFPLSVIALVLIIAGLSRRKGG